MNPREIEWLGKSVSGAQTLVEAQLAVSIFIAAYSGLPLRPLGAMQKCGILSMLAEQYRIVSNRDKE